MRTPYTAAVEAAVQAYELAAASGPGPGQTERIADMDAKIAALTEEEMTEFTKAMGGSSQ